MLSFLIGAAVMAIGGVVELMWGVKAEGQRLETLCRSAQSTRHR
jgi:hypothetical protein